MRNIKFCLFSIFIVFNINGVLANTADEIKSLQKQSEICGERACEFIFKEMRKFAANGSPLAQATLSLMYAEGIGTEMDQDLSYKYIKRAANSGLPFAEYKLGMLYRQGERVDKFGRDADYWLMRAAKANYKPAINLLLNDGKINPSEVNHLQKAVYTAEIDENIEVIVVTADKFSLTDFYDLLKSYGHDNLQQTGSRIKGRGCGNGMSPCATLDINTPMGALQFLLFTLKVN